MFTITNQEKKLSRTPGRLYSSEEAQWPFADQFSTRCEKMTSSCLVTKAIGQKGVGPGSKKHLDCPESLQFPIEKVENIEETTLKKYWLKPSAKFDGIRFFRAKYVTSTPISWGERRWSSVTIGITKPQMFCKFHPVLSVFFVMFYPSSFQKSATKKKKT